MSTTNYVPTVRTIQVVRTDVVMEDGSICCAGFLIGNETYALEEVEPITRLLRQADADTAYVPGDGNEGVNYSIETRWNITISAPSDGTVGLTS